MLKRNEENNYFELISFAFSSFHGGLTASSQYVRVLIWTNLDNLIILKSTRKGLAYWQAFSSSPAFS